MLSDKAIISVHSSETKKYLGFVDTSSPILYVRLLVIEYILEMLEGKSSQHVACYYNNFSSEIHI